MSTNFNPDAIKTSAGNLGKIMDDMSAFDALKPQWPNAGRFPTAQWLERLVDDRRNGVVAHAEHLKLVLDDMRSTLVAIADDFTNTDGENAAKIKASIDGIGTGVAADISAYDQTTESKQHNFSGGPAGTADDGDGYNDVLRPGGAAT